MAKKSPNKMEGMKALVLGGLGFIGSNVVQRCVSIGADVTAFDCMIGAYDDPLFNIHEVKGKVKVLKKDMRNADDIGKAVAGMDYIFNCAGQVSHMDSMTDPHLDIDLNLKANINFLEACRRHNDDAKIVYVGTRAQVGKAAEFPVTEDSLPNPVDIYGINKHAAESYHLLYGKIYGMGTTSLRLTNAFGERSQMKHGKYGIMNWFIRLGLEGKKITVYGDGRQKRDYLYVDDVVDALVLAAMNEKSSGNYYMVSSGKTVEFIDMVKSVIKACGSGSYSLVPWPEERKNIEAGDFEASYEKIRRELGWKPKTSFEDGLSRTVQFYKKNLEHYT